MLKCCNLILRIILLVAIPLSACKKPPSFECQDTISCVTVGPNEPVKIGVIMDISGGAASFSKAQLRGVQLALDHREHHLLGHPIELQIEDEQCTPEGGKVAAQRITANEQTLGIIGTTCSGAAVSASKVVSEAGMVMISGLNTAPSLTSIGNEKGMDWQPGYFRTIANDALKVRTAVSFAYDKLGVRRAATVDDGDAYTSGATEIFAREFIRLGGEIVLQATVDKGDTAMKPMLTAVVNAKAQVLYMPLFPPEGIQIIWQARQMPAMNHIPLIGGSALLGESAIKRMGQDGVGMYFSGFPPSNAPKTVKLIDAYEAKYAELPDVGFDSTYDATRLLLNAIENVAVLHKNSALQVGRQALRDALYATADFEGATGRLSCNNFGDCGVPKFTIFLLDDPAAGIRGLVSNIVYTYEPK